MQKERNNSCIKNKQTNKTNPKKKKKAGTLSCLYVKCHKAHPYLSKHITLSQPLSIVRSNNRKETHEKTQAQNAKFTTIEVHLFKLHYPGDKMNKSRGKSLYVGFALKYTERTLALHCIYASTTACFRFPLAEVMQNTAPVSKAVFEISLTSQCMMPQIW